MESSMQFSLAIFEPNFEIYCQIVQKIPPKDTTIPRTIYGQLRFFDIFLTVHEYTKFGVNKLKFQNQISKNQHI